MGFFDYFKKQCKCDLNALENEVGLTPVLSKDDVVENNPIPTEDVSSNDEKPLKISYATGWPIDVIYGYLHKNHEEEGFRDAMLKSDMAFCDMNMEMIKSKILMVFREINLNYDVMKSDFESRIEICRVAGLLTTVSKLEKSLTTIRAHKDELRQLEMDFRNNANEASIPLKSYKCGFLRGIATIALSETGKSVVVPTAMTPLSYAKATA